MALHDVQVLREVVKKLVPMIAGRGVRVTQMGAKAYVLHDKRTGKIERVNIPHVADDADASLILAIQGFIDHEVGHVLDTNWKAVGEGATVGCEIADEQKIDRATAIGRVMNLANIVEDPFVERCMQKRFPGVAWNLDRLYGVFTERMVKPALAEAKCDADRFAVLLVPIVRSIAGQKYFTDFLDAGKHWDEPLVKAFTDRVTPALRKEIATVKTSWDSLDIARQLYHILYPPPPPPPPPPPAAPPKDPKKDKGSSSGESKEKGEGAGSSDKPEDEEDDGSGGEKMSDEPPESPPIEESKADDVAEPGDDDAVDGAGAPPDTEVEPEAAESDAAPEDSVPDTDTELDGDADESGEADETAGEDAEGEGKKDEGDKPAASEADAKEAEAGSGGEEGDEDGDDTDGTDGPTIAGGSAGEAKETPEPSPFDAVEVPHSKDLSDAISDMITDEATRDTRGADYRLYTTEWDVIEPLEVGSEYNPAYLEALDNKTRHMVAPMQKEIERIMAARSQVVKVPGFRSGRLHSGSLHRLRVNDDRVFRRKQENRSRETAVSLVVDNSGSMSGNKTRVAMAAAYALSQTLERLSIKHEVIGFTTKNLTDKQEREIREEESRIGRSFSRTEPMYMPIYKGFEERLDANCRARFAKTFGYPGFLSQNIDGESVAVACYRLMKQREPRKVMLVFSDGDPACCTTHRAELYSSLHKAVANAKKMGIELVGIGIEDDTVKTFYPKYIVLEDVEALPRTVMGELKRILLSPVK